MDIHSCTGKVAQVCIRLPDEIWIKEIWQDDRKGKDWFWQNVMGAGRMVEREKPLLLVSDYDSMIRGMVLP
jgi:hypothetical protein